MISTTYNSYTTAQVVGTTRDSLDTLEGTDTQSTERKSQEQDTVSLSSRSRELAVEHSATTGKIKTPPTGNSPSSETQQYSKQSAKDNEILRQLKSRDAEVRAHEQAHLSVAGRYASGGASFTYETGPDGAKYAIGGEVPIDMSTEATPEATLIKMETIKRAALAPADPSPADRQIAAAATAKELQAIQQIQAIQRQSAETKGSQISSKGPTGSDSETKQNPKPTSSPETSLISSSNQISIGNRQQMMIQAYRGIASLV